MKRNIYINIKTTATHTKQQQQNSNMNEDKKFEIKVNNGFEKYL